ncbi:hypothetical protein HYU20_02675 [Candidatus Woesearchaeota archaeon]|nr:hypothetical protein [Candidatus Woesearchaeota archaeon]
MGRSGWYGQGIRHSLAARGIRIKRNPESIYDVRGLENLVGGAVDELGAPKNQGSITGVSVGFYDWEIVVDASKFGEKPSAREMAAAQAFIIGFDRADRAYVFVGKGGTFVHPSGYRDNHYMQPVGYFGQAILLARPVELCAMTKEGGTGPLVKVPFAIAGLVGLERLVNNAHTNGHRKGSSRNTAKLGV